MRTLFFLLLFANLTLFAYTRLDSVGSGEAVRLSEQVNPDKVRILTPQEVAALGPEKTSALSSVCAEWGPFAENERVRAQADLEPFAPGKLLQARRVEAGGGFWAFVPAASRAAAERRASDLKTAGVREAAVVEMPPQRFAVSLGTFRTSEAAQAALSDLARQGVADGQTGPKPAGIAMAALVVRDPNAQVIARLKELQPAYPGTEIRIGGCERAS